MALCCVYVYNYICSISTHPDDVSLLTLDLLWQLKGSTPVCSISIGNYNLCNISTYIHVLISVIIKRGRVLSALSVIDRSHLEGQSKFLAQNLSLSRLFFTFFFFTDLSLDCIFSAIFSAILRLLDQREILIDRHTSVALRENHGMHVVNNLTTSKLMQHMAF